MSPIELSWTAKNSIKYCLNGDKSNISMEMCSESLLVPPNVTGRFENIWTSVCFAQVVIHNLQNPKNTTPEQNTQGLRHSSRRASDYQAAATNIPQTRDLIFYSEFETMSHCKAGASLEIECNKHTFSNKEQKSFCCLLWKGESFVLLLAFQPLCISTAMQ